MYTRSPIGHTATPQQLYKLVTLGSSVGAVPSRISMGERLDDARPVLLFVDGTHSHMGEDAPMALFRPASPKDPANTNRAHPILRRADFSKNLRTTGPLPAADEFATLRSAAASLSL